MTELATSRIREEVAATAASSVSGSGHGIVGSWLPGSAYSRGFSGRPRATEPGPSTTCSLTITASKPACSASTAIRTSAPRSRGGASVQFSDRMRTSRGGTAAPARPADIEDYSRNSANASLAGSRPRTATITSSPITPQITAYHDASTVGLGTL